MNFKYLVESCASQYKGQKITLKLAEDVIRNVFDDISQAMARGEKLSIRGFGTFSTHDRAARDYHNPLTNATINVGPKRYPKFSPSRSLKAVVAEPV